MHADACSFLFLSLCDTCTNVENIELFEIDFNSNYYFKPQSQINYNMKVIYNHKLYNDVYARVSNIILKLDIMIELFSSIHTFNQQIYFFLSDATSFPPFFVSSNAIAAALNSSTVNTCDLHSGQVKLED